MKYVSQRGKKIKIVKENEASFFLIIQEYFIYWNEIFKNLDNYSTKDLVNLVIQLWWYYYYYYYGFFFQNLGGFIFSWKFVSLIFLKII
jgi:hypothetical protein